MGETSIDKYKAEMRQRQCAGGKECRACAAKSWAAGCGQRHWRGAMSKSAKAGRNASLGRAKADQQKGHMQCTCQSSGPL